MPVDTTPTPVLPPRRTWRDLPATPPVADFLPPPDPDQLIAPPGEHGEEPPADDPGTAVEAPADKPRGRKRVWLAVGAGAALLATVGAVAWSQGESSGTSPTTPTVAAPSEPGSTSSVQDVAKALSPAVVQIEIGQGLGSGVIYDSSGLILTAHHVVAGADEVTVRTADEQELPGRVVGRAPRAGPGHRRRDAVDRAGGGAAGRGRQRRGRRDGHRARQPVRLPADRDVGHRERPRP